MKPAIGAQFVRVSAEGLHGPPAAARKAGSQPPTQIRVPAPVAMEDRAGGYDVSDIARLFPPYPQQDPGPVVIGQRKKHPASGPEPLEPQRSRVRRASVDEDCVYWPWIEFATVASDYADACD